CGMQRKVGAAPHRGNANRPLANQGKAPNPGTRTTSAAQANKPQNGTAKKTTTNTTTKCKNP
ncbi:hypothetical protein, partial [Paraburkholderia sediminicola]|uniref:hypothetical protein n=1 Tax=Paraburkholderia sediminicola TaxID=458836 RepID=UPI0038BCD21F